MSRSLTCFFCRKSHKVTCFCVKCHNYFDLKIKDMSLVLISKSDNVTVNVDDTSLVTKELFLCLHNGPNLLIRQF